MLVQWRVHRFFLVPSSYLSFLLKKRRGDLISLEYRNHIQTHMVESSWHHFEQATVNLNTFYITFACHLPWDAPFSVLRLPVWACVPVHGHPPASLCPSSYLYPSFALRLLLGRSTFPASPTVFSTTQGLTNSLIKRAPQSFPRSSKGYNLGVLAHWI